MIKSTFHGLRVMKGHDTVNQSISSSFDPAKLVCICCKSEHPVVGKNPVVIFFSDQNFFPNLSTTSGECIHVVRLENALHGELYELAIEMFRDVVFPEGSVPFLDQSPT